MPTFLYVVAALEVLTGVGVFAASEGAIHEILGTLMLGFAFLTMALAAILGEMQRHRVHPPARSLFGEWLTGERSPQRPQPRIKRAIKIRNWADLFPDHHRPAGMITLATSREPQAEHVSFRFPRR